MTIDRARVLADIGGMLGSICENLRPGDEITRQAKLVGDLGLRDIAIANLAGRVKSHYGATASLIPFFYAHGFFTSGNGDALRDLAVGELVEHLAGMLGENRAAAQPVADGTPALPHVVPPAPPDPCLVIIGSGRCGSTMLSRLIASEPRTLSVSESLVLRLRDFLNRDPDLRLTGGEYWAILSRPDRRPATGRRLTRRPGWSPAQFSYPATGRYAGDPGSIPPILVIALPQLADDPDRLFDQLGDMVPGFPPQTALGHHKMLLDLLANLTGKLRWAERTGGSSDVAGPLLRTFRDAKIVYLTRNIPDTALSMSRHPAFQMTAVRDEFRIRYGVDPFAAGEYGTGSALPDDADMPADLRRLLPHRITSEALRGAGRDIHRFECMVAHMNGCAEQALADAKPRHLYRARYEDILDHPKKELTSLGEFLEFADPARWAAQVADQVRPAAARLPQSP
jgi:putative sulfotransferase